MKITRIGRRNGRVEVSDVLGSPTERGDSPDSLTRISLDICLAVGKHGFNSCEYFGKNPEDTRKCYACRGKQNESVFCPDAVALDIARRVNALGIEVSR